MKINENSVDLAISIPMTEEAAETITLEWVKARGGIFTEPGVARCCTRCSHHECPSFHAFCETCRPDRPDSNVTCVLNRECLYDRPEDPRLEEFVARMDALDDNGEINVGVMSDGRYVAWKGE